MKMTWPKTETGVEESRRLLIHKSVVDFLWRILEPESLTQYWIPAGLVDRIEPEQGDVGACEETSGEAEEDITKTYSDYGPKPWTVVEGADGHVWTKFHKNSIDERALTNYHLRFIICPVQSNLEDFILCKLTLARTSPTTF
jgi:hypothetical protein